MKELLLFQAMEIKTHKRLLFLFFAPFYNYDNYTNVYDFDLYKHYQLDPLYFY